MNQYPPTNVWSVQAINNCGPHFNPLPAFGSSFPGFMPFPTIQEAIDQVEMNVKAPRPMILLSALATISTVLQGLIDVKTPAGVISPVSLMLLTIADGGERKSTVENVFDKEIRRYEDELLNDC